MSVSNVIQFKKKLRTCTQEEIDAELSRLYNLRDQVDQVRHPASGSAEPLVTPKVPSASALVGVRATVLDC